ncbi:MAG: RHS repeat-associated core domain-containing protein [Hoylesella enoeca]|uniref:RHS repeat-associated core domain-containing protein n=1 Tax=Hoylesella enoeca TaxID=76123 RepID=UPI003F9F4185
MDENGTKVFEASYDAWGKQTVTLNTIGLHRGYTGHKMLSEFDIINMNQRSLSRSGESNGRLYDPILGRFFSPDNYVQMPDNSQNFNRYSYCLNNPLKYTDPSGELFGIDDAVIAFTVFNVASSMMQASFEGKSVWKAGALSLLSSAATYGIGEAFKGTAMTFGNELLRAGAHGLSSAVFTAIDGGNFVSGFASGALSSGIGSYAQCVNMNSGLMIASTTAMGGAVAWATGGDFLQGAMQGMTIGLFNHAMHDGDGEIRYYHDKNGNIRGEISEVVVIPSRHVGNDVLGVAVGMNTILDGIGTSMKKSSGNSSWGSNRKIYWHATAQRGFYGNQYVKTIRLNTVGKSITKVTSPIGILLNVSQVVVGAYDDYQYYRNYGYTDGYNTVRATAEVAGSWTGAWAGLRIGGLIGGSVGAVPGAIIGGIIGGVGGAFGGSYLGTLSVDKAYGR